MGMTGNRRMMKVPAPAGLSDNRAKSKKNGHSGRGLAPASVGSGGPLGPFGPRIAARITTAITAREEKRASFSIASPRKGTPVFSCFSYSWSYVFGSTGCPEIGGATIPGLHTSQRWRARSNNEAPVRKKRGNAHKRLREQCANDG